MVEVWMTLVIIFGSEKVSDTDWLFQKRFFTFDESLAQSWSDSQRTDLFLNILLNNWLIGFLKPIASTSIWDWHRWHIRFWKLFKKFLMVLVLQWSSEVDIYLKYLQAVDRMSTKSASSWTRQWRNFVWNRYFTSSERFLFRILQSCLKGICTILSQRKRL